MKRILAVVTAMALLAVCFPALGETTLRDALGAWEGDTYTNPFLGLGCTLPNGYHVSEEGILEANQFTKEMLEDDLKTVLKSTQAFVVMAAFADPSGMPNIIIQLSYLSRNIEPIIQKTGVAAILPGQLSEIRKSYESGGAENLDIHLSTVSIDGRDEAEVIAHYSAGGTLYSTIEAVLLCDGCLAQLCVTVMGDNEAEALEMLSSFFWVNESSQ